MVLIFQESVQKIFMEWIKKAFLEKKAIITQDSDFGKMIFTKK